VEVDVKHYVCTALLARQDSAARVSCIILTLKVLRSNFTRETGGYPRLPTKTASRFFAKLDEHLAFLIFRMGGIPFLHKFIV
jgi:hypothetical protein